MNIKRTFLISITLSFMCTTLQNCSSTLILGTATLATKILKDPRTIGTQINDKALEMHISNALSSNKKIQKNTRIINSVYQGNVLLIGQSPSLSIIKQAEKIVMNIEGTKKIYNEIRNIKPITCKNILLDWWISGKIHIRCLTHSDINLSSIKIITENKEVFLLGKASDQEKRNIIRDISKIKEIKHIIIGLS